MKKLSLLGVCPVCDCSWRGASFRWIYREADKNAIEARVRELREINSAAECPLSEDELRAQYPKPLPEEMILRAAQQHRLANQSILQMSADSQFLHCPTCGNRFLVSDFNDSDVFNNNSYGE